MSENVKLPGAFAEDEKPSVAAPGMTSRVVKGSLWTLLGQVFPLLASLIATPFVIRFLGSEGYGVYVLIGLIPSYFAFADFGMGIASTKFGAEFYGQNLRNREGEVVRTAGLIAFFSSLAVAVPLFIFSRQIVADWFKIPENYQSSANLALKIAAVSFVLTILSSVFNTPQIARLRMDLNTLVNALPRIAAGITVPFVLFFGGNIVEAIGVAFFAALITFAGTIFASGKLLPELFRPTINRNLIRPLVKFGGNWLVAMIAAVLLVNVEKFFLARYVSVKSLAFYSVAYTFANMATLFSASMQQSLVPAFAQLLAPEKRAAFDALFARTMRLNLIWILPALMFLFVIAKPFFTIWAGAEFGAESSPPFYFLLFGLLFNIPTYVSYSTIMASGRTDIFAKLYWIELIIYIVAAFWLVNSYQIVGAAAAWSLRIIVDAVIIIWLAKRLVGVSLKFSEHFLTLLISVLILLPPIIFALFYDNFSLWLIPLTLFCAAAYSLLIWKQFIEKDERNWLKAKLKHLSLEKFR